MPVRGVTRRNAVVFSAVIALLASAPLPAGAGPRCASSPEGRRQAVLPALPWPPVFESPPWLPAPLPGIPLLPGIPPLVAPMMPLAGDVWTTLSGLVSAADSLSSMITALEQAVNTLTAWATAFQQSAADDLTHLIWESRAMLPSGVAPPDLIGQINLLPSEWRGILQSLLAKFQAPDAAGALTASHEAYLQANPPLAQEASGIVATDEIVAGGATQQEASMKAASLAAATAADDTTVPEEVAAAQTTGGSLVAGAENIPSTRVGVELLIAGMGSGMQQQAELGGAVADRLSALMQQTAQVSQQIGALAETAGALAARDAERDRRSLDETLNLADALKSGSQMFEQMLADAADDSAGSTIRIDPLY